MTQMNSDTTTTVGLDIGTTRTKVVLRDVLTGEVALAVSAPTPVEHKPDGDRRDPYQVLRTVVRLLRTLSMRRGGLGLTDVIGVSAACVGEELAYLGASGQALGTHRCWYEPGSGNTEVDDRPLNAYASWYALSSDAKQRRPQHLEATAITDLGSWVLMMLCDTRQPVTDRSHASRTGLLNGAGAWSASRVASCKLTLGHMPRMVDSGERVGEVSESMSAITGLPEGTAVRAGGHDHLCAALACGVRTPGDVFVSVGTSESQLMVLAADYMDLVGRERPGLEFGYFTWQGLTYLHAAQPSGRRVAEIIADDAGKRSIQQVYEAMERSQPEGAPWPGPDGLRTDDSTVNRLWSELNRQARTANAITEQLQEVSGHAVVSETVSGVPTRHRVWRDIRTHTSARSIRFDLRDELSGLGAGILGSPPATRMETRAHTLTTADGKDGQT